MIGLTPDKTWWTAKEIAGANLPDMPETRQGVEKLAKNEFWRDSLEYARKRAGRGGGFEYHWKLFPDAARRKLLKEARLPAPQAPRDDADSELADLVTYFDSLPDKVKDKVDFRLKTMLMVQDFVRSGEGKHNAVVFVSKAQKVAARTIWNWNDLVQFRPKEYWRYYLAPRNRTVDRSYMKAPCSHEFMVRLKADYLRLEAPTFTSCYRRVQRLCATNNWQMLPERTARRRMNEIVPQVSQILAREGITGLERCFPPQERDRSDMTALDSVNADCHKIDVFVNWPDGTVTRPQIVAFQDIYSGKMLSWRVDHTPNKVAVMSAFGDMIDDFGIPKHCLFDNGREFANKWITGGTKTRFRYKIRDEDPLGVLPAMGIDVHWATPGRGQSKPIERAFRDWADDIAKDPRFAGAYVGNRPDAKPENYGSKSVPIDKFLAVLEEGIAAHNARDGRRTDTAQGRSFDATFNESYAQHPVRKATAEQCRLWLMGQEVRRLHKTHGQANLHGNKYWSDWMSEYAGQQVVLRFDPEDLHAGAYLYKTTGEFLGFAACQEKSGFWTLEDAQETARQKSKFKRIHKKLLAEIRPMDVDDIAAELDALPQVQSPLVEAKVVTAPFGKRAKSPIITQPEYAETETAEDRERHTAFVADFPTQPPMAEVQDTDPRAQYQRALALEQKIDAGAAVGDAELHWLHSYQQTAEYRAERIIYEDFKDSFAL